MDLVSCLLPTPLPFSIQNKTPNGLDYPAQFEDGKQVGQPMWLATQKPGSCTQMGCSDYAKTKPTWIDFEGNAEPLPVPPDVYNTFNLSPDISFLFVREGCMPLHSISSVWKRWRQR